jgi:hypothetical protein
MREHIAELCASLLLMIIRALLPARGRHRAAPARPHIQERTTGPKRA